MVKGLFSLIEKRKKRRKRWRKKGIVSYPFFIGNLFKCYPIRKTM